MNTCESYAALLDAFAEGDLFTEDMLQVQTHLNNCPACQAYLDDLFAIRAAFPTIEETEVPAGFSDRVMAAVAAQPRAAAPVQTTSRKKQSPWAKVVLPLAACCAIVVLLQGGPFGGSKTESAYHVSYTSPAPRETVKSEEPAATTDAPAVAEEGIVLEPQAETAPAAGDTASAKAQSLHTADSADAESDRTAAFPAYQHVAELPAQAAALLKDFTPVEETADAVYYQVSTAEYTSLQKSLADAGISYLAEAGIDPTTDLVLIVLSK